MPEMGICPLPKAVYIFTIEYIDSVPISERFFYFQHDLYRAIFISKMGELPCKKGTTQNGYLFEKSKALSQYCDDEKGVHTVDTLREKIA